MSLVLILELGTVVLAAILYFVMKNKDYKHVGHKLVIMFLAILLFMMISEPMYRNPGLHAWAYLYHDIPWTLVLGWTGIFLLSIVIVDHVWPRVKKTTTFWLYLAVVTLITVPLESLLLKIGIRGYAPMLTSTFSGVMIPVLQVPLEVLLAVPIIAALVISFYKHFTEYY